MHHSYFFQFDFSCEMSDLSIELKLVSSECSLLLFFIKELETRIVYSRFIAFCISAWRSRLEPVIIEPAIIEPVIIEPVEYRCIRR